MFCDLLNQKSELVNSPMIRTLQLPQVEVYTQVTLPVSLPKLMYLDLRV